MARLIWREESISVRFVLLAGLLAFGIFLGLSWAFRDILWDWEQKTVDYRFRLRGPIPIHPAIVHIDIDDESLKTLGPWPWKRSLHGGLVRRLHEAGVKAQVFDIIFSGEKDHEDDAVLVAAARQAGTVYLPVGFELRPFSGMGLIRHEPAKDTEDVFKDFRFSFDQVTGTPEPFYASRALPTFSKLSQAAAGIGHITATPDSDGVFRRVPLVVSYQGRLIPSLSLAAAIGYLNVSPSDIEIEFGHAIRLKNARLPGMTNRATITIPINRKGEMVINYAGRWDETFSHDSAVRVLTSRSEEVLALKAELNGKLCIISLIASGMTDIGPIPIETFFPLSGIHPNILNTILTQQFLYELDPGVMILITIALAVLLLGMGLFLRPASYVLAGFLVMSAYTAGAYGLFKEKGLLLNLTSPWLSGSLIVLSAVLSRYWLEEKERRRLQSAFELYLSPQILKQALEHSGALSLGGKRKELTVLFSDIMGFSALADKLESEETQSLLNDYFDEMTRIVFQHGGTIDKFIGDGLMALWGDPLPCEDHALRAVRCAVEMQKRIRELQTEWRQQGRSAFEIRIGVNTGWMTVGNMGSQQRMSYTVIGKQVNLSQRLEAAAEPGGILISERTYGLVRGQVSAEDAGEIKLKNFDQPVRVYKVKPSYDHPLFSSTPLV